MNKQTKIFIVILNWNRAGDTIECLNSVVKLSAGNSELSVVIVDNASTDDSVSKLERLNLERVPLIILRNHANLGFAGGNNVGIKFAIENGANYVLILNNDIRIDLQSTNRFIDSTAKDPKIGLISPKIYFEKGFEFHKERYKKEDLGKVIWYAGGVIDWNNVYGSTRGVDEVDSGQYDKSEETDFATGACLFMSREFIERVGMFDEKYFLYYEDTDLSVRAKKAGFKVIYEPKALCWHKVAQSSGIGSGLNDYYTTRNRMLFGIKYAQMRTKFALLRESAKLLLNGRKWQKVGIRDFYLGKFGKGSWK